MTEADKGAIVDNIILEVSANAAPVVLGKDSKSDVTGNSFPSALSTPPVSSLSPRHNRLQNIAVTPDTFESNVPENVINGIALIPDGKARCLCGNVINRSSVYRHAIAGDGHCSGGAQLSEDQISAMREITFAAKASYMRAYREKTGSDKKRRASRAAVTPVTEHLLTSVRDVESLALSQTIANTDVACIPARTTTSRSIDCASIAEPQTNFVVDRLVQHDSIPDVATSGDVTAEETSKCPAAECGRTVRSRNLFEHVSSKTCRGGHLLSSAQLCAVRTIAKAARVKYNVSRKAKKHRPESFGATALGPVNTAISASNSFPSHAFLSASMGPQLHSEQGFPLLISQSQYEQPNTVIGASRASMAFPNLLDMSIRDIGVLMARVVCRGHNDSDKKPLEVLIVEGVQDYRLTALVLCAKKPPSEVSRYAFSCCRCGCLCPLESSLALKHALTNPFVLETCA